MFEQAFRLKLRFSTERGNVSVEDLWDIPLTNGVNTSLDNIEKSVRKKLKDTSEDSFVSKRKAHDVVAELRLEIVRHIILIKLDELEAKESELITETKRRKIDDAIAFKENEELNETSLSKLKKMRKNL